MKLTTSKKRNFTNSKTLSTKFIALLRTILPLMLACIAPSAFANNLLVQNVTTTGNDATNKTIQVQFDLSWDNSWRDDINWDAAWIFIKFKDGSGNWQHAKLNTTGFANGTGTANTVKVTADNIGCWVYRSANGSGTFNSTTMQLQWNYGLSGLTSVIGLEIRVFAIEMVYVPQGDFNCTAILNRGSSINPQSFYFSNGISSSRSNGQFYAPGDKFPVINSRMSPTLYYSDQSSVNIRIKGDVGIDTNNDGVIDITNYPIGFKSFYSYKYGLTEQQYADFLNTLSASQVANLGVAGTGITLSNGQYFSSTPNKSCGNANANRLLSYADWSGVRPMSLLEFNKAAFGPQQPILYDYAFAVWNSSSTPSGLKNNSPQNAGYLATSNSTRLTSGASYYGLMDLIGSTFEPIVKLNYFTFGEQNGDGMLASNGYFDVINWNASNMILFIDLAIRNIDGSIIGTIPSSSWGFRYVRSAE